MAQREIFSNEIIERLITLFELNEEAMRDRWKVYDQESDGSGKHLRFWGNLQEQLLYTPSVEIVEKNNENTIISIGTQHEVSNFEILTTVTNSHPVESFNYLRVLSHSIFELLNDFNNRSFNVPRTNFCVYYSEASNMDYGFRRGKGLLSCRIQYQTKLLKPNRFGTITPC